MLYFSKAVTIWNYWFNSCFLIISLYAMFLIKLKLCYS